MRGTTVRFLVFALATSALTVFIGAQIQKVELGERYTVQARFADVTGLFEKDDVRVAGVTVGSVESIGVEGGRAVVTLAIDDDVRIPADSRASITWLDLIGARQVDLLPGSSATLLEPGGEITDTRSAVDIGTLTARLGPLARTLDPQDLNELLDSVYEVLEGNEDVVVDVVRDTRSLLSTVTSREAVVDALLRDYADVATTLVGREQQLRTTIDDLTRVAEAFTATDRILSDGLEDAADVSVRLDAFLDENADDLTALVADLDVLIGTFEAEQDTLDETLAGLPAALGAFRRVGDQGDLLYVHGSCVSNTDPPCERGDAAASGVVRLDSPDRLAQLLAGQGVADGVR